MLCSHMLVTFAAVNDEKLISGEAPSIFPLLECIHTSIQLHLRSNKRKTVSHLTDLQTRFVLESSLHSHKGGTLSEQSI